LRKPYIPEGSTVGTFSENMKIEQLKIDTDGS